MEHIPLKKELNRVKTELILLYEISNAMRTTLKLPEIIYIILTAVTFHEGLGFNRAMLFLINERTKLLEGIMGVGPADSKEAEVIWKQIEKESWNLNKLTERYHRIEKHIKEAPFNKLVNSIKVPISEAGGILASTVLEGMNFKITTEEAKNKTKDILLDQLNAYPCVSAPLKGKNKVVGALVVDNMVTKKPITKDDIRILTMIANQAGLAIENSMLYEQMRLQANIDSLTRAWNHGHFQYLLKKLLKERANTNRHLSLAMMDLDNFKAYNDKLGHQKGDIFLKTIAAIFKSSIRKEDFLCRYGGEEFALIMPDITKQNAFYIVERLRKLTEEHFLKNQPKIKLPLLSISSGISSFPDDGKRKLQLIAKADEALYKAKRGGKNKTYLA